MIILRSQAEDRECSIGVPLRLVLVRIPEEASDAELAAFDPELGGFVDGGKCHEAAVRSADEPVRVVGAFNRTCGGFEFAFDE